jgi:predicted GH43/DUF377 family glycosyl hydrolase
LGTPNEVRPFDREAAMTLLDHQREADTGILTLSALTLGPDPRRVITAPFVPGGKPLRSRLGKGSRTAGVVARIMELDDGDVAAAYAWTMELCSGRHRDIEAVFADNCALLGERLTGRDGLTEQRKLLIGAYFTLERAIESAALTNPSMVEHPDQRGAEPGSLRFVMSVRAIGECHVSCIEFRTGTVDARGRVSVDRPAPYPAVGRFGRRDDDRTYDVGFPAGSELSERVLWPHSPAERCGMEDARFVRATGDEGARYLATYTGFDGSTSAPRLIETDDFRNFRMSRLRGRAAGDKGLALFPRTIGGTHFALSRWDRENTYVATSPDGRRWEDARPLRQLAGAWELVQGGNCGSPVEIPEGWLVLTHGVGPMRSYTISAMLLDRDDPRRVVAVLDRPLLTPDVESGGYVPNIVYSCGALRHGGYLVVPFGVNDTGIRFASVSIAGLVARMRDVAD